MDANLDNALCAEGPAVSSKQISQRDCAPGESLSLVLPAYNEQATIAQAIREADTALAALMSDYEILVVDDGSTDATYEIASNLASEYPAVKVLRQPRNIGYGAALRLGFAQAKGSLLAFTDADCQFHLEELDRLLLLAKDYDIVCGYRIDRQDSWHRCFYSATFNLVTQMLLGTRVRDCDCALKVIHRRVFTKLEMEAEDFFFNAELLAKARQQELSVVEVGVTHRPRAGGESKVSLGHALPVGCKVLRFWWQQCMFPTSQPETRAPAGNWSRRREWGAGLLLAVVACLLLFSSLSYPLIDPDETRYAQIAYEMVESGDWITPRLEGNPYLDKPPLLYWATASCYLVFGVNETAARLPCALAAFLTVLLTYTLGKRLVGSQAAWLAAIGLLLCGGFVMAGRFIMMDGLLTLFCFVGLTSGYLACRGDRIHWGWWLLGSVACGLGVLCKGPIAVVLCLPPLLAVGWLQGNRPRITLLHWIVPAAILVLMNAPWFIAVSLADRQFPLYFFWKHNIVRFVHTFHHHQPWWFYIPVFLIAMFPVSLLLPMLGSFLLRRRTQSPCLRTPAMGFLLLSSGWVVLFFSLSSCKLPSYILPAIPPLCLLLGSMLTTLISAPQTQADLIEKLKPLPRLVGISLAGLTVVAAGVELTVFHNALWAQLWVGTLALAATFALIAFWRVRQLPAAKVCAYAVSLGLCLSAFFFQKLLPEFSLERSVHVEVAQQFQHHEQTPILYFSRRTYSAVFHLDSDRIVRFNPDQINEAGKFLQSHAEVILVTTRESANLLREQFGSKVQLTEKKSDGTLYLTGLRNAPVVRLGGNDASGRR